MELRDLRAFVLLSEVLHFRQAAERLHLTQSALSKQIQKLEAEFGVPLFERGQGATRLTPFGRIINEDAKVIVEASKRLSLRARLAAQGLEGSLRIGFGLSTRQIAPRAVAAFRVTHPQVQIQLVDMSARHQFDALKEGRLDLGYCRLPAPVGWPTELVMRESMVVAYPGDYPEVIVLDELRSLPLIMLDRARAPGFHDHAMAYLTRSGVSIGVIEPVAGFSTALAMVTAGIGWAIVPRSKIQGVNEFHVKYLDDEDASWEIGLVRPPGELSLLVQAYWEAAIALRDHG